MTNSTTDDGDATPGRAATQVSLRQQFERVDLADHIALFYETRPDQQAAALAFVRHALEAGGRVLYITNANTPGEFRQVLRDGGVGVAARERAGDLDVRPAAEAYLDGGFDPDRMLATLEEAVDATVAGGYEGLYVAGENTWCFDTSSSFDEILDFERRFDDRTTALSVTALCQYDLEQFDPEAITDAVQTHSQIIYRETLCRNPYFVPAEEYLDAETAELTAERMLEQTHELAVAIQEASRREERLDVVNRVLRHNLRNGVTLALGRLADAREHGDDTVAEYLAEAEAALDDVLGLATKARKFDTTVERDEVRKVDVVRSVTQAREQVRQDAPEASIEVDAPEQAGAFASGPIELAEVELLGAAMEWADGGPVRVTVERGAMTVDVTVATPDAPVPEHERAAVRRGREGPLEHGGGLSLWLVKWVVENADGRLTFAETDDGHPGVRLEFPA